MYKNNLLLTVQDILLYFVRGMNMIEAGDAGVTCFPIFPGVVVPSSLLWPTSPPKRAMANDEHLLVFLISIRVSSMDM